MYIILVLHEVCTLQIKKNKKIKYEKVSTILRNGTPSSIKYLFYGTVPKQLGLDTHPPTLL